jgi:hypothetical protein
MNQDKKPKEMSTLKILVIIFLSVIGVATLFYGACFIVIGGM